MAMDNYVKGRQLLERGTHDLERCIKSHVQTLLQCSLLERLLGAQLCNHDAYSLLE